jgi:hypothetical protein
MVLAHAAGIRVFVTGGIGGVHRGYDITQVCGILCAPLHTAHRSIVSSTSKQTCQHINSRWHQLLFLDSCMYVMAVHTQSILKYSKQQQIVVRNLLQLHSLALALCASLLTALTLLLLLIPCLHSTTE